MRLQIYLRIPSGKFLKPRDINGNYFINEDYQAVRLSHAGYKVEMWVSMPSDGRFDAVLGELGLGLINEIEQQAGMAQVTLTLF